MYQGMSPAEKYIVATVKRYQNLRCHSFSCVNMNPRKEEPMIVHSVPSTVRPTEISAACPNPWIFMTST